MRKVLLLNKAWTPIASTTLKRAISIVCRNHGFIVDHDTYERYDWVSWLEKRSAGLGATLDHKKYIKTGSMWIEAPLVVTLANYAGMPKHRLTFSRRGLYARDSDQGRPKCQYCGSFPKNKDITIDHVVPRALGGRTSWENCVVSCMTCNLKKAALPLEESGMSLCTKPIRPTEFKAVLGELLPEWEPFLGSMK